MKIVAKFVYVLLVVAVVLFAGVNRASAHPSCDQACQSCMAVCAEEMEGCLMGCMGGENDPQCYDDCSADMSSCENDCYSH